MNNLFKQLGIRSGEEPSNKSLGIKPMKKEPMSMRLRTKLHSSFRNAVPVFKNMARGMEAYRQEVKKGNIKFNEWGLPSNQDDWGNVNKAFGSKK